MKKIFVISFLFAFFAVISAFAEDFKSYFDKIEALKKQGISYDVSSVTGKKVVKAKVYMKGDKIRMDIPEGSTIIDDNSMYVYSTKDKMAMKMNIDKESVKQATFDVIQDKASELKFVEKSSKNGYSCQVFSAKNEGKDIVYYLTDKYGFPTYVKEENSETNITDFKVGNVSDNIFVLPKDVNVIDMNNFSMEDMIKSMQ